MSRGGTAVDYFPYGEEKTVTANPAEKFGTYLRDATGLDYANQRFYSSATGRFLSSDPYQASAGAGDPGSWNRSAYVGGDPTNYQDQSGLNRQADWSVTVTGSFEGVGFLYMMYSNWRWGGGDGGGGGRESGGGGGGGGNSGTKFTSFSGSAYQWTNVKSSADWSKVTAGKLLEEIVNLKAAIATDKDCQQWLNKSTPGPGIRPVANNATAGLDSLPLFVGIGQGTVDAQTNPTSVSINNTNGTTTNVFIIFNSTVLDGTSSSIAETILHELGHLFNLKGMESDDASPELQTNNRNTINSHCGNALNWLRK